MLRAWPVKLAAAPNMAGTGDSEGQAEGWCRSRTVTLEMTGVTRRQLDTSVEYSRFCLLKFVLFHIATRHVASPCQVVIPVQDKTTGHGKGSRASHKNVRYISGRTLDDSRYARRRRRPVAIAQQWLGLHAAQLARCNERID